MLLIDQKLLVYIGLVGSLGINAHPQIRIPIGKIFNLVKLYGMSAKILIRIVRIYYLNLFFSGLSIGYGRGGSLDPFRLINLPLQLARVGKVKCVLYSRFLVDKRFPVGYLEFVRGE